MHPTGPIRIRRSILRPAEASFHRAMPSAKETFTLFLLHVRLKRIAKRMQLFEFVRSAPNARCKPRERCRAERGGFAYLRAEKLFVQDVRLELHEEPISGRTTVDPKRIEQETYIYILFHMHIYCQ